MTINVSGIRYETCLSTLERYPDSLLSNKEKRQSYWNNQRKEYFFDRHRTCFESILYYYQSYGRLRRLNYVPMIKYIDLSNWLRRRYIWIYLEYPQNSLFARILYFISMFFTVLSYVT